MGNCASAGAPVSPVLKGTPHCTICDTSSDKPLSKLSRECRDEWVVLEGPHGQEPCHRRCVVARKLEQERHKRERCSYERAKQLVYPLPTSHLDKCSLHRVGSGQEWADSDSFHSPYRPSPTLAGLERFIGQQMEALLQQQQQVDGQAAEAAAAPAQSRSHEAGSSSQEPPPAVGDLQGSCSQTSIGSDLQAASTPSATSEAGALSRSSSSGSSLGCPLQDGVACGERPAADMRVCRRPLLRRPSPIHHPALLEAKTLRRISGIRPAFDSAAMQLDADGAGGKEWRSERKACIEEARRREQARRQAAADCNGFD